MNFVINNIHSTMGVRKMKLKTAVIFGVVAILSIGILGCGQQNDVKDNNNVYGSDNYLVDSADQQDSSQADNSDNKENDSSNKDSYVYSVFKPGITGNTIKSIKYGFEIVLPQNIVDNCELDFSTESDILINIKNEPNVTLMHIKTVQPAAMLYDWPKSGETYETEDGLIIEVASNLDTEELTNADLPRDVIGTADIADAVSGENIITLGNCGIDNKYGVYIEINDDCKDNYSDLVESAYSINTENFKILE